MSPIGKGSLLHDHLRVQVSDQDAMVEAHRDRDADDRGDPDLFGDDDAKPKYGRAPLCGSLCPGAWPGSGGSGSDHADITHEPVPGAY